MPNVTNVEKLLKQIITVTLLCSYVAVMCVCYSLLQCELKLKFVMYRNRFNIRIKEDDAFEFVV